MSLRIVAFWCVDREVCEFFFAPSILEDYEYAKSALKKLDVIDNLTASEKRTLCERVARRCDILVYIERREEKRRERKRRKGVENEAIVLSFFSPCSSFLSLYVS